MEKIISSHFRKKNCFKIRLSKRSQYKIEMERLVGGQYISLSIRNFQKKVKYLFLSFFDPKRSFLKNKNLLKI